MGHGYSRHNSNSHCNKRYENSSVVFAYSKASATSIYIKQQKDKNSTLKKNEDNLLLRPRLYGLADIDNTADSDAKDRLRNDIMYIDQTYYAPTAPTNDAEKKKQHVFIKRDTKKTGRPLQFRDIPKDAWEQEQIIFSSRHLHTLSPHIGYLTMIRKLDLSHNQLKEVPAEIGHLYQLEVLCLAHNQLQTVPNTIGYLTQLIDLNLTWNQLNHLTPFIGLLKQLKSLYLGHNQLKELPASIIRDLNNLALLDLSYNTAIHILPAEITQLPYLRRLRLDGCSFEEEKELLNSTVHSPPSLFDSCARDLLLSLMAQTAKPSTPQHASQPRLLQQLRQHNPAWADYLSTAQLCSHCRRPFFNTYITRYRLIERNDIWISLEYRLCSAHWTNEEADRMYAMFSSPSVVTHPHQTNRKKPRQQSITVDMSSIFSAVGSIPELPNLLPLTTNIADQSQKTAAAASCLDKQTCKVDLETRRSQSHNITNNSYTAVSEQQQQQQQQQAPLEQHQHSQQNGTLRLHYANINDSTLTTQFPVEALTAPLLIEENDAISTTATSSSSSSPVKNRWQRFLKVRNCSSFVHKYH